MLELVKNVQVSLDQSLIELQISQSWEYVLLFPICYRGILQVQDHLDVTRHQLFIQFIGSFLFVPGIIIVNGLVDSFHFLLLIIKLRESLRIGLYSEDIVGSIERGDLLVAG